LVVDEAPGRCGLWEFLTGVAVVQYYFEAARLIVVIAQQPGDDVVTVTKVSPCNQKTSVRDFRGFVVGGDS